MLRELAPVPDPEKATEEEVAQATEKQQNLVRDLFWLSEQGYILVFSNNTVSRPKAVPARPLSQKGSQGEAETGKRRRRTCRWRKPPRPRSRRRAPLLPKPRQPGRNPLKKLTRQPSLRKQPPLPWRKSFLRKMFRRRLPQKPDAFPEFPRHTVRRIILILRTLFCRRKGNQQDFTYDQYNNGNRS